MVTSEIVKLNLLICIFNQIPNGCTLWVADYIDEAFNNRELLKLKEYLLKVESGVYAFSLSPQCLEYLQKSFIESPLLTNYFVHYGITLNDKKILMVFDGFIFVLCQDFNIPDNLLRQCEGNEIYVQRGTEQDRFMWEK